MKADTSRSHSRRDFIKSAAVLPLCAAAVWGAFPAEAREPVKRAGGSVLKVSLNAYSFNKLLNDFNLRQSGNVSLMSLLDFCAKNGFDAIDPTGYFFPGYPKAPSDDYINTFKRTAFEYGLGISGTGVRNNFTTSDKAERAASMQLIKDWVEVAARLGAPVIRVFGDTQSQGLTWQDVARGFTREQVQAWMVDALGECAEHGKKFGVIIGVQNHGDFIQSGDQLLSLVNAVNSDWCGVIVDTGKFVSKDPYQDIAQAAPYAVNWQIKQSPAGADSDVPTDLVKLMRIVRASGYRGYLPIETLAPKDKAYDPFTVVPPFLKQVREAINQTA
jgi:sugar phosphate isomerase/epimerase